MKAQLLILILLLPILTPAQIVSNEDKERNAALRNDVVRTFDSRYEGVKGFPFLFNKWIKGEISFLDGKTKLSIPIKYDIYKDEVRVLSAKDSMILLDGSVASFTLLKDNKPLVFRYLVFTDKNGFLQNGFFQVLYEGKWKLFARKKVNLIEADYKGAYSTGKKYDEFQSKPDVFFISKGGEWWKIKIKKKDIVKVFKNKSKEIDEFLATRKGKFKTAEDLIKLLSYLDQN